MPKPNGAANGPPKGHQNPSSTSVGRPATGRRTHAAAHRTRRDAYQWCAPHIFGLRRRVDAPQLHLSTLIRLQRDRNSYDIHACDHHTLHPIKWPVIRLLIMEHKCIRPTSTRRKRGDWNGQAVCAGAADSCTRTQAVKARGTAENTLKHVQSTPSAASVPFSQLVEAGALLDSRAALPKRSECSVSSTGKGICEPSSPSTSRMAR